MGNFLGKLPPTDAQLEELTDYLRFDNFRKMEAVNKEEGKGLGTMNKDGAFIRKGITIVVKKKTLIIIQFLKLYRKNWRLEESFQSGIK